MKTDNEDFKNDLSNEKNKKDGGKRPLTPPPIKPGRTLFVWILLILGAIFLLREIDPANGGRLLLQYSEFEKLMDMAEDEDSGIIEHLVVTQSGIRGIASGKVYSLEFLEKVYDGKRAVSGNEFSVHLPFIDSALLSRWKGIGFPFSFKEVEVTFWSVLLSAWPVLLLIAFWFFMFRNMNGGGGQKGVFSFGKSKAKLQKSGSVKTTFADVAGADEAKRELEESVDFLKKPEKYSRLGGKIPKGVLLLGQPGTGKTLLARAVAGEAGVPFFSMSGSDFVEMFVGVGASRVRNLFEDAKKNAPCIIFIDEIDAVGRQRGTGLGGGHDEREQTLNQMLVEMDGFETNSGIIVMAATNRADVLDPALLRPGRFDRQIVVDAPDILGREGILRVHTRDIPLDNDVDLNIIAKGTPGFVGADLANLVNEAALFAARFSQSTVTMLDFEEARDKIIMGTERNSKILSEKEKRTTAYHEAGHAICTLHCPEADELHKVTIIPRGGALGVTFSLPGQDRHSYCKEYMEDRLCVLMGGRVAEKIVFNSETTGASNDIKVATGMAHRMICEFGMSELGPVAMGSDDSQVFLGRDFSQRREISQKTAEKIDQLTRDKIMEQEARAFKILTDYRNELDLLAEALLEHEHLDKDEISLILSGNIIEQARKSRMTAQFVANRAEAERVAKEILENQKPNDSSNVEEESEVK